MHAAQLTRAKLMTLALGIPGGALFYLLNLPLPWMLGAMAATTVAAISGVRVALMPSLRLVFVAILGVMLGSAFTPEVVKGIALWFGSFAWLALYVVIATAAIWLYYRRLARYDSVTAYFSAAPGGLNEMILAGGALGGDERRISMSHAARILIAIFALSFGYRWFGDYVPMVAPSLSGEAMNWLDWLLLTGCGVVGFVVARALRIPAYALVGPMVLSALVHALGITHSRPPVWLVAAAQVVVGAMVGSRFDGAAPRMVGKALILAVFATAALLGAGRGLRRGGGGDARHSLLRRPARLRARRPRGDEPDRALARHRRGLCLQPPHRADFHDRAGGAVPVPATQPRPLAPSPP